jgi:hypothetical protein
LISSLIELGARGQRLDREANAQSNDELIDLDLVVTITIPDALSVRRGGQEQSQDSDERSPHVRHGVLSQNGCASIGRCGYERLNDTDRVPDFYQIRHQPFPHEHFTSGNTGGQRQNQN